MLAKLVLDNGAAGIIVPSVNTPAQAAQAVAMAKYPPEGTRGAALCRATDFGRNFNGYFRDHNQSVVVVVMIEHRDALPHLDAILGTPGIDAAFIGPYDLSASMGLAGQLQHPEVLVAQQRFWTAAEDTESHQACMSFRWIPGELQKRLAQGFRFVACGLDTLFIQHGCRTMLRELRTHNGNDTGN